MNEMKNDMTRSVMKLMRAMRRHPMRPGREFPPAVGRTLMLLSAHDGATSAELCERMDVRPSSMSQLLSRMEEKGLIARTAGEEDRRTIHITLTEAGLEGVERIRGRFTEENARLTACFTEDELALFCQLCDRLSAHLESLPETGDCPKHGPCHPHHGPMGGPRCHRGRGPRRRPADAPADTDN